MSEERLHPNLVLQREEGIEILRIDREESLGALNFEIMEHLADYAADVASRRDKVRVIIITGTGRGFVAGADIAGYHGAEQTEFDGFQRRSRATFDAIATLPQITICAVNGYALGGGFELAMCCDFILVNAKTKMGLPEIKLGLLPGGGGTQRLPRLVGPMRAKEMLLTGRMITANEAVEYGAALEACEPDALMPRALELAEELAAQAPVALAEGKRVIDDGLDSALSAGLTFEQRVLGALFATADGKEGIAAFMEKRDPKFLGR
ncbi:MAG: enoyl-CoA hydratase-related protein [Alphaproteobacteria bacterium]|nr:enoyl-CoA hydratase-related protein [Alphaproteobacteria bacterium]